METLEKNDIQMINLDGKELTVVARFDLCELFQGTPGGPWNKNGKRSRAICLAGDTWLMRVPRKEAGEYIWLKMKVKDYASNLSAFYRDGDGDGGPAKKFAKSGQSVEIPYRLFDEDWKVEDIGAFLVEGDDHKALKNDDRIYFVTSKGAGKWLLYLDARHGEAKGTGMVLIGEEFNPDVDIQSTL